MFTVVNRRIQELRKVVKEIMNKPTPNFISQVAASSQMLTSIEEHNSISTATNAQPVSAAKSVKGLTPFNGAAPELSCQYVASEVSTGNPSAASFRGVINAVSSIALSPSNCTPDAKGLASALEGNALESSEIVQNDPSPAKIGRSSPKLVTAEELGLVENLSRWLKVRLSGSVLSQWGVAEGTKRVSNLWSELVAGESSLEDGRPPKRTTHVASVKIRNGQGLELIEASQEMSDGTIRERNRALSEKMKPGENVEEACRRGILEELGAELGAKDRVTIVPDSYVREQEERDSISYPGLPTLFIIHSMEARIQKLPATEFSTDEAELDHGGSAINGEQGTVGVRRHFWKWVPASERDIAMPSAGSPIPAGWTQGVV